MQSHSEALGMKIQYINILWGGRGGGEGIQNPVHNSWLNFTLCNWAVSNKNKKENQGSERWSDFPKKEYIFWTSACLWLTTSTPQPFDFCFTSPPGSWKFNIWWTPWRALWQHERVVGVYSSMLTTYYVTDTLLYTDYKTEEWGILQWEEVLF